MGLIAFCFMPANNANKITVFEEKFIFKIKQ